MDTEDIVNYLIVTAIIAVFVLAATGKFLDLSVERQSSVQTRATINVLQKIVTDGPILVKDPVGGDRKIMIDADKLGSVDLSLCCDSVQFDYQLDVGTTEGGGGSAITPQDTVQAAKPIVSARNYEPKPGQGPTKFNIGDQCYYEFGIGSKRSATLPVNICRRDGGVTFCSQGIAALETTDSPLSQLSYWLTQVCNSQYDTQKRIPLSKQDYVTGLDLSIEEDESGKKVCLKGVCKRFECQSSVDSRVDSALLNNRVAALFSCHFAVVEKKGGRMSIYEGFDEPKGEVEADDFPPGQDEWTESYFDMYTFQSPDKFNAANSKVAGIDAAKNEKYIAFKVKPGSEAKSLEESAMYLDMSGVEKRFPALSGALDCGPGKKCVKMKEDGKTKYTAIRYQARIHSDSKKEPMSGSLTWKLTDTDGNCIEKKFSDDWIGLKFGQGKQIVDGQRWTPLVIPLLEGAQADEVYMSCGGKSPREFSWQVAKIEWNVCERVFDSADKQTKSCLPNVERADPFRTGIGKTDSIQYLLIDNLYFDGEKEGA